MLNRPVIRTLLPLAGAVCGLLAARPAEAVEFELDGYYRVEGRLFDTLSLNRGIEDGEQVRDYFRHRLKLAPAIHLNPSVHIYTQMELLDLLPFGGDPELLATQALLEDDGTPIEEPAVLSQSQLPGERYQSNFFLRRAWAEVNTPYVDIRIGRMPSHWGMGVMANDGDCDTCDYGDTVDRIQISTSLIRPLRISLAFDTHVEGFWNQRDDVSSFILSGGYLGEAHAVGVYLRWLRQPSQSFNALYASLWGRTRLGPISMELEGDFVWGRGNFAELGLEDARLLAGGGAFKADVSFYPLTAGVHVGLATGDEDPTDERLGTFTFDRDHNVALILFEEKMPVYQSVNPTAENGNVDESRAITYDAVSNAFYLNIHAGYEIIPGLAARLDFIAAWALVTNEYLNNERRYGVEIDLDIAYQLHGHVEFGATAGVFIPDAIFTDRQAVFGGEARMLVRF